MPTDQKRALDSLELELVVSHLVRVLGTELNSLIACAPLLAVDSVI